MPYSSPHTHLGAMRFLALEVCPNLSVPDDTKFRPVKQACQASEPLKKSYGKLRVSK